MKHGFADRAGKEFGAWLAAVAAGETVVILDGGVEVARLLPPEPVPDHLLKEKARREAFANALREAGPEALKKARVGLQYNRVVLHQEGGGKGVRHGGRGSAVGRTA